MTYEEIIAFHGHSCPGIAIGYRMAQAALHALAEARAEDEEIVAIVENDACGVDALQCLTGCTFGKGNFIFRDYGKQVYTLFSRKTKQGVRVVFNEDKIPETVRKDRQKFIDWILGADEKDVVTVREVTIDEPERAVIRKSVLCARCGERVMETRTKEVGGRLLCIPCAG